MKKESLYHLIKLSNKEKVVLVKCGKFYKSYDEDAIIISYLLNYKINDNIVGFPKESLYKIINTLNKNSLSVIEVIDENNYKEYKVINNNYKEYKVINNNYNEILDKANTEIELNDKVNNIIKIIENKLRSDINLYNLVFKYIDEL